MSIIIDKAFQGEADLVRDLTRVLNIHGVDSSLNTPDYLLGEWLLVQLHCLQDLISQRELWFGREWRQPDEVRNLGG